MNNIILIEHVLPSEGNIITESTNGGKNVSLKGIMMQSEVQNRNKRRYMRSELTEAVALANQQIQAHGGIFGELDHPQGVSINMDRISHVITELYMDGDNAIGTCKLLNTPMGLIAKELANSGCRYGVSSRGMGRVNESNGIVEGFTLVTVDLVATPSAAGAMPIPVYESLQDSIKGQRIMSLAESVQEDANAQKYLKKALLDFMEGLKSGR
jgi:Prohead core protein protease.